MALPEWVIYIIVIVSSYLVGSIPTGYVLGKILKNIDIRDYGSGNTGFSNVYRILGPIPGIITLVGDIVVKGGVVSWAVRLIIHYTVIVTEPATKFVYTMGFTEPVPQAIVVLSGLMAIAGHNWSIYLKFKGGKGMATTAGVFINFVPVSVALLVVVWLIVLFTTRYTSLANLVTTPTVWIFILLETRFIMDFDWINCIPLTIGGVIAGLFILWSHRENIKRLISKTERKFGDKSERIQAEEQNSTV